MMGLFERMKQAIGATKSNLVSKIENLLARRPAIEESLFDELEGILLGADVGVAATAAVLQAIRERRRRGTIQTPDDVRAAIRLELGALLEPALARPAGNVAEGRQVWMVVGVNGTGKTTTAGKLAARLVGGGKRVLICAADTFRPAAIEQLTIWAERSGADIVKTRLGADPSSVLHDALAAASARDSEFVIVDTAGRLHTKSNLMSELEKMRRVAARKVPGAPHEVLLVLDATTGQNGLQQAREFQKSAGVTGLVVTKLDGTAKGGVLFGIVRELGIPVRYVGIGESIEDLVDFDPKLFVASLFGDVS